MKESESKEQLYICDHADGCGDVGCVRAKRHGYKLSGFLCGFVGCNVSDIPYKEEPEKSCDNCWREDDPVCVKCSKATMSLWTPKEEKAEPKTKRVGVIWFGEVPVDKCENPVICDEMTGYVYGQVELINPDRLRYGNSCVSDKGQYITTDMSIEDIVNPVYNRLIIDPPTLEPETLQEVLERVPKSKDYYSDARDIIEFGMAEKFLKDFIRWEHELNEAKEREENK